MPPGSMHHRRLPHPVSQALASERVPEYVGLYVPIGPKVVPFWGSVIPKRNYFGAYGYACLHVWSQASEGSFTEIVVSDTSGTLD